MKLEELQQLNQSPKASSDETGIWTSTVDFKVLIIWPLSWNHCSKLWFRDHLIYWENGGIQTSVSALINDYIPRGIKTNIWYAWKPVSRHLGSNLDFSSQWLGNFGCYLTPPNFTWFPSPKYLAIICCQHLCGNKMWW